MPLLSRLFRLKKKNVKIKETEEGLIIDVYDDLNNILETYTLWSDDYETSG